MRHVSRAFSILVAVEALELRDGDKQRLLGKGVLKARNARAGRGLEMGNSWQGGAECEREDCTQAGGHGRD